MSHQPSATPGGPRQSKRRGAPRRPADPADRLGARPRAPRSEPDLPDDVVAVDLDPGVRRELLTLAKDNAEVVARHLVMAARTAEDPELSYAHARAAASRAGRIAVARETAGLAAYAAGRYDEALRELRTARRLSGDVRHLPVIADAERGLGRPERALETAASPEAEKLEPEGRAELRIVASGARSDLGDREAAVLELSPERLTGARPLPWHARTYVACADALVAVGREGEAQSWLTRARAVDPANESGAFAPEPPVDSDAVVHEEPAR